MSIVVDEGRQDEHKVKVIEKPWPLTTPSVADVVRHEEWVKDFRALCDEHDAEAARRETPPLLVR